MTNSWQDSVRTEHHPTMNIILFVLVGTVIRPPNSTQHVWVPIPGIPIFHIPGLGVHNLWTYPAKLLYIISPLPIAMINYHPHHTAQVVLERRGCTAEPLHRSLSPPRSILRKRKQVSHEVETNGLPTKKATVAAKVQIHPYPELVLLIPDRSDPQLGELDCINYRMGRTHFVNAEEYFRHLRHFWNCGIFETRKSWNTYLGWIADWLMRLTSVLNRCCLLQPLQFRPVDWQSINLQALTANNTWWWH